MPVRPDSQSTSVAKSKKRKRARNADKDDTPQEFKRLMAFAQGKRLPSGLDGGPAAKGNNAADPDDDAAPAVPTIQPGEKLSDFSARVNAALPISGLKRGGKDPLGIKAHRTRKEKKMHKLYDQWRAEERKIQERKEDELELEAEKELNNENGGGSSRFSFLDDAAEPRRKGKKKGRSKVADDDDPWQELKRRRAEAKIGLHDVALAPPELHKGDSAKRLSVQGAAVNVGTIPKSAGSLRKREQLNEVRDGVVEAYRNFRTQRRSK